MPRFTLATADISRRLHRALQDLGFEPKTDLRTLQLNADQLATLKGRQDELANWQRRTGPVRDEPPARPRREFKSDDPGHRAQTRLPAEVAQAMREKIAELKTNEATFVRNAIIAAIGKPKLAEFVRGRGRPPEPSPFFVAHGGPLNGLSVNISTGERIADYWFPPESADCPRGTCYLVRNHDNTMIFEPPAIAIEALQQLDNKPTRATLRRLFGSATAVAAR